MEIEFKHDRYIMCCHVNRYGDPVLMYPDDINIIDLKDCKLISYEMLGNRIDIACKESRLSLFQDMIISENDELSFIYCCFLQKFNKYIVHSTIKEDNSWLTGIELFNSPKKEKEYKWLFKIDKEGVKIYDEDKNKISDCR